MMSLKPGNIAILQIKNADKCRIIRGINKSKAINLMGNVEQLLKL